MNTASLPIPAPSRATFLERLNVICLPPLAFEGNYAIASQQADFDNQEQTNSAFSDKWETYGSTAKSEKEKYYAAQRTWYLSLYGFDSESELAKHLQRSPVIFDAGCGLGYKAAWFAELAPESLVIGMDYSTVAAEAAESYTHLNNLFFIRGDIAASLFTDGSIDYVSCDQVIMHTENPDKTFAELSRITRPSGGQFACYFYTKKALPRELVDDYFRTQCSQMTSEQLWEMSKQLTELGKRLSEVKAEFDCPAIPALGIKEGRYDIQRFLYWNFLKCYWNEGLGRGTSDITNFDWYSPSNARRYSEEEVKSLVADNAMTIASFHREEACYSGRFVKP